MGRSAIKAQRHMYAPSDLTITIRGRMHGLYTQKELGEKLASAQRDKAPLSQQSVSCKIRDASFDYRELIIIFELLGFSDEEIVRCMRGVKPV